MTAEGWTDFAGRARKFHFVPSDDNRALCGKWMLSPFIENTLARSYLQPDEGQPSTVDCVDCRRKFDRRALTLAGQ